MAISYNDWKKQYDTLDSAGKQRYADLAKNSVLGQQYMSQYNSEKNTPTIGGQSVGNVGGVKTYQVAKNTTPTIGGKEIKTQTPTTDNPTIGGKPLLTNGTKPVGESVLGGSGIKEVGVSGSEPIINSQPGGRTRPVGESVLGGDNIKEVGFDIPKKSGPKSIFDKPENPATDFKVLGINPYGKGTEQKGKTETKQPSVSTSKTQGYVNPKQVEWDYQDNSQARMDQIADNLNKYTQTNPELFKDYDTFYNFFIAGKGRSNDQKKFLDQYYANYKKTEKYNNMSPEELGNGIANGEIPEDSINDIASKDPMKAEAIKGALKDAQDGIANESYLSELAGLNGFHAWNRKEMLYKDENNDGLDDRLYHEPTEEERTLVEENSNLESERLKLSNAMKDLQSDLKDQYPDADLSTIMLLTSDRGQKIQKALDTLNVTQTKVQGTLKYLQTERATMDKAGQNTIAELQKNYGLYMQYSPEGIKQLADAQYAATHVTLDQADSGTELDKQKALDNVLQGYYDKYGSIIQRSQQQVINDVIAHAKKNGISLSQALEENFLQPLRSKPQFNAISSGNQASGVQWTKVGKDADGNDIYGFVNADTMTVSPYGNIGGTSYSPEQINSNRSDRVKAMAEMAMGNNSIEGMANAIAQGMNGMGDGDLECGVYTNDYINAVTGTKGGYGNSIESKIAQTDNQSWDGVQVGDAIVFDWSKNTPQWVKNADEATKKKLLECGHVGFVTGKNSDGSITISHTNGGVVTETTIAPGSDFYNSFVGSQHVKGNKAAINGYNEQFANEYSAYFAKPGDLASLAKSVGLSPEEFREQANAYSRSQTAGQYTEVLKIINKMISDIDSGEIPSFRERKQMLNGGWLEGLVSNSDTNSDWYADNQRLVSILGLDALINLKGRGATFGALSDSEREAINSYATSIGNPMSDTKYKEALKTIKKNLLESNYSKYFNAEDMEELGEYDPRAGI